MAALDMQPDPKYLRAIVDMGSNGIRFSISNLAHPTARIMPTLYQHRAGISLYDAQWSASGERQPISEDNITAVISSFKQFERTCADFGVLREHITVLATEATRTAINSEEFRGRIKEALGWEVTLMPKEEEGRVGAMGIASSLPDVNGLTMDLGGGSTQLSWLMSDGENGVKMPESGAVSMPYGAAAMSRRLAEAEGNGTTGALRDEIMAAVKNAFESLKVPAELLHTAPGGHGYTLFLSGGGFRGWGYLLMSQHQVQPYPIPVINGFKALRSNFLGTEEIKTVAAAALQNEEDEVFRVSDRRASQVPAVAFLINVLAEAMPAVAEVRFCQGGVREGWLFSSLPRQIQSQRPLVVATQPYSRDPSHVIKGLLEESLPPEFSQKKSKESKGAFSPDLLEAFANMMYYHSTHSKDLQTSAALRCTTSGVLAGVHGLLHESRAALALLLCSRWGNEVAPVDEGFKNNLEALIGDYMFLWIIRYLGAVAALIAVLHPAGFPQEQAGPRLVLGCSASPEDGSTPTLLRLLVRCAKDFDRSLFAKEIKDVEKLGKKKNWVSGKGGVGFKVEVLVESFER